MRTAIALIVLAALAAPTTAAASDGDDRPFGRGVLLPSLSFGGGFAPIWRRRISCSVCYSPRWS